MRVLPGPGDRYLRSLQIDHVISQKHGGRARAENLALSCIVCNQQKGSDIAALDPVTGDLVPLFNPREHEWIDQFEFSGDQIRGLTPSARATVELLRLNAVTRIEERRTLKSAGVWLPHEPPLK